MKTRALIWTNDNGDKHIVINTLEPHLVEGQLRMWLRVLPETNPRIVEVEIREVEAGMVDRE